MQLVKPQVVLLVVGLMLGFANYNVFAESEAPVMMDNKKLDKLIKRFDNSADGRPGFWQLMYEDIAIYVVTDEKANRMRIMVQVAEASQLKQEHLYRLMQANFDSALDARYAIAQERLWSAFIHPLGTLSEHDFFSGLAQVVTLARTFGTTFSSGALTFNGGDSQAEQEKLYQKLLKKGLSV